MYSFRNHSIVNWYHISLNPESAAEVLTKKMNAKMAETQASNTPSIMDVMGDKIVKNVGGTLAAALGRSLKKSLGGTTWGTIGAQVARGLLGSLFGGK